MKTNENKKQHEMELYEHWRNAILFVSRAEHELMRMNVYFEHYSEQPEVAKEIAEINNVLYEQRMRIGNKIPIPYTIEAE